METPKIEAFLVRMTDGSKHKIDASEVEIVAKACASGSICVLKQIIITNPNTISYVEIDVEEIRRINEKNYQNAHDIRQGNKQPETVKPLMDYFAPQRSALAQGKKMLK